MITRNPPLLLTTMLLSSLALFLSAGCAKEGCLTGTDPECVVPSPCEKLAFACEGGSVSLRVLEPGDPRPGGLTRLAAPGDVVLRNGLVEIVIEALDHPHYLSPTGGAILDFATAGDDNDSLRHIFQAMGVLPNEAVYYTSRTLIEEDGLVAVQFNGYLDGRPDVPVATRYELRPCEPGVRVRTEVVNREPDPISVLNSDGYYFGARELLPFTPGPGRGYEQPSFGLSTLGDAVLDAPYLVAAGHSEPAASYATISCSADVLTGFQSDEVAANGNRRRIVMPRDFDVFERFIVAAKGASVSVAADIALEVRRQLWGEEYVTLSGRLATPDSNPGFGSGLRAAVLFSEGSASTPISERTPWTQALPAADGSFSARVPAGRDYVLTVESLGRMVAELDVTAGSEDADVGTLDVPAEGKLRIDGTVDGVPDHILAFVLPADDATEAAVAARAYGQFEECAPLLGLPHGPSPACDRVLVLGPTEVQVPPGNYDVFAAAGPFSTLAAVRGIQVAAGELVDVSLPLTRLDGIQPPGTLSGDFHVHGGASFDSNMPHLDRVRSFLASGIQVIAATDHDAAFDYASARAALGADDRMVVMTGTENTGHILFKLLPESRFPKVVGHWNIWPIPYDDEGPYGGAWWDEKAEPGTLFARAQGAGWPADTGVIQLNHPIGGSSFGRDFGWASTLELKLNEPLKTTVDGTEQSLFLRQPEGSSFRNSDYNVQEVMNGTSNGNFLQYRAFWHYLLSEGLLRGGTANSDTHSLKENVVGIPRNLVYTDTTLQDWDEVAFDRSVREGRMIGTNGPVVEIETTDAGGAVVGPSIRPFQPAADAELHIRVVAAPWVPVDEVRILVGGELVRTITEELLPQPDPYGSDVTPRLDLSIPLSELATSGTDSWLVVEVGHALEPNSDLNCDGIPDTGDNNRDGVIDWRDVEDSGLEAAPEQSCLEDVGPLTAPAVPDGRESPLYLFRAVTPGGYPLAFTNPLILDWASDGYDAPGAVR